MAGHNKWSKVKRLTGALDANRGKLFSRLAKEITLAARTGGESRRIGGASRRIGGGAPEACPRRRSAMLADHLAVTARRAFAGSRGALKSVRLEPGARPQTYFPDNQATINEVQVTAQFLHVHDMLGNNGAIQCVHAHASTLNAATAGTILSRTDG